MNKDSLKYSKFQLPSHGQDKSCFCQGESERKGKLAHSEHFIFMERGGGVSANSGHASADTWHRVEAAAEHYGLM